MTAGEGYIEMTMHRRVFLPLLSTFAFGQYEESKGDVPWVPTPDEVMDTMFRMAKLKASDIVYDLGSGDGRVLIYAAGKFGARGVGVEIEGHRVKESREAAQAAGVSKRVRFIERDLFKAMAFNLHSHAAGAELPGRVNQHASVAAAEIVDDVARLQLGHAEHRVHHLVRRGNPRHVAFAFLVLGEGETRKQGQEFAAVHCHFIVT